MALLRHLTVRKTDWPLLTRPSGVPTLNHTHITDSLHLEDYTCRVGEWATAVWQFWTPEHRQVKELLDRGRTP